MDERRRQSAIVNNSIPPSFASREEEICNGKITSIKGDDFSANKEYYAASAFLSFFFLKI